MFNFTCSGVRGSLVVVVCSFFPTFWVKFCPFYHSFSFPFTYSIMRTSFGPSRPSGLRIGGSSIEGSDLGQIGGGSGHPTLVVDRVPLVPFLLMKKARVRSVRSGILVAQPT